MILFIRKYKKNCMCRSGFKLFQSENNSDSGKCFSLTREGVCDPYEVILGDIYIHPNLLFNMSYEALNLFILGKLKKNRCFKFVYTPQFEDQLRICISIERGLDFYFSFDYADWCVCSAKKTSDYGFPNFVKMFDNQSKKRVELQAS